MRSMHKVAAAMSLSCIAALAGSVRAEDAAAVRETVIRATHVCVACHGEGGRSETKSTPSLAGQSRQYLITQLTDFRSQFRAEASTRGYMWGISAQLDDATTAGLADSYAEQKPAQGRLGEPGLVEAGRTIFLNGIPARGVRACASCHGEKAEGAAAFPRLAGQRSDYVYAQLKEFGTALRPHGVLMREETKPLLPTEMRALAEYVQSL